jgi:hypothetical protein
LFTIFFTVSGNAQVKAKPKLNELSLDELKIALGHSNKTIRTGKILTLTGLGVSGVGFIIMARNSDSSAGLASGYYTWIAGNITWLIGLPIWISGSSKKNKIMLEMIKFIPLGSTSMELISQK